MGWRCEVNHLGKGTKLMRQLLIRSYLEFCQQYRLHCRWDKISLEGTDDLHSKDKTVAQQQQITVIPQLSRAQILQQRHNSKKTLHVCLCVSRCMCACVCVCVCARTSISTSTHVVSFIFTVASSQITQKQNPVCNQLYTTITTSCCATHNQYGFHLAIS